MPSVNQISPALNVAGNSATTSLGTQTVDYDAFLSLLVAQLKNQDPTAPSDQGEFIAQLASFSSVEQQIQANDKLNSLIQANLLGQAAEIIGHTVTSADGNQSGVVVSVTLGNSGLVARLEDGTNLPINNGVIIQR